MEQTVTQSINAPTPQFAAIASQIAGLMQVGRDTAMDQETIRQALNAFASAVNSVPGATAMNLASRPY
jgi:hypothetical protein